MKEVNYYECEVCGERFDDSWECKWHELAHMIDEFDHNDLMVWNCDGERISVEELAHNYRLQDDIYAVETTNETARAFIRQMFDEVGEHSPYDECYYPHEPGLIYWDEDNCIWVNYEDKLSEIMDIRCKFDNSED